MVNPKYIAAVGKMVECNIDQGALLGLEEENRAMPEVEIDEMLGFCRRRGVLVVSTDGECGGVGVKVGETPGETERGGLSGRRGECVP